MWTSRRSVAILALGGCMVGSAGSVAALKLRAGAGINSGTTNVGNPLSAVPSLATHLDEWEVPIDKKNYRLGRIPKAALEGKDITVNSLDGACHLAASLGKKHSQQRHSIKETEDMVRQLQQECSAGFGALKKECLDLRLSAQWDDRLKEWSESDVGQAYLEKVMEAGRAEVREELNGVKSKWEQTKREKATLEDEKAALQARADLQQQLDAADLQLYRQEAADLQQQLTARDGELETLKREKATLEDEKVSLQTTTASILTQLADVRQEAADLQQQQLTARDAEELERLRIAVYRGIDYTKAQRALDGNCQEEKAGRIDGDEEVNAPSDDEEGGEDTEVEDAENAKREALIARCKKTPAFADNTLEKKEEYEQKMGTMALDKLEKTTEKFEKQTEKLREKLLARIKETAKYNKLKSKNSEKIEKLDGYDLAKLRKNARQFLEPTEI